MTVQIAPDCRHGFVIPAVEIRIRYNGTGIPADVKDKMRVQALGSPLVTTIIVKQHGGSIEVDSQPGEFTEIGVILPRVAAFVRGRPNVRFWPIADIGYCTAHVRF